MSQSSLSFGPEWMRPKSKAPDGKTPLPTVVPNGNKAKMAWSGVAAGKVATSAPNESKKLSFASANSSGPRKFKKRDSLEGPDDGRANSNSATLAEVPEPATSEVFGDAPSPLLPNAGGQRFSTEEMLAVWRNMKDKNQLHKSEASNGSMYQSIHLNTPSLLQKDQNREGWSPFKSVSVVTNSTTAAVPESSTQQLHHQVEQLSVSSTSSTPIISAAVPSAFDTFNAPAVPPGIGFGSPPQMQSPGTIQWFYKDYQGTTQGSFSGPVMHTWFKGGHLDSKLFIRREDEDEWYTLGDLMIRTNTTMEPFMTPLPRVKKEPAPILSINPNAVSGFSQQQQLQQQQQQQLQQQQYQQSGMSQQYQHQKQETPLQQHQQLVTPQPTQQYTPSQGGASSFQHYPQHLHGSVSSWSPTVTSISPTPWGGSQVGQTTPNNNFGSSFFGQPFQATHSQSSFFDDKSMWRGGSVSNTMSPALSRTSSAIFPNDGLSTPTRAGSHTPIAVSVLDTSADNELLELDSLPLHLKDVIGDDDDTQPDSGAITATVEKAEAEEVVEEKKEDIKEEPVLTAKEKAKKERDAAKKEKKRKEKEEKQRIKEKMAAEKAERLEREAREKAEKARLEQLRMEQEILDREEAKKVEAEKARRAEEERLAKLAREKQASMAKETKKKEKPNKMSLAEIQQLEELDRQARLAQQQEAALALRIAEEAEREQQRLQESSFKPTWADAPIVATPAKSLSQIQQEEAARKKTTTSASSGVKRYADVLPRRPPLPVAATAPANDSPWTTIGAHGKRMAEDGLPARSQTPTAPAAHIAQQPNAMPPQLTMAARAHIASPATAPKVLSAAESFLQWCHGALRGLNSGVDESELIGMLMTLPAEDESTEIITDIIYANSSTMDGRRFATEFLKRRKVADGDSAVKWSEVIQQAEVVQDDGWNTAFKVVGKKKRAV